VTVLQIPSDAKCSKCGYALRALETPRCPECGHAFDPSNLLSMDTRQRRSWRRRMIAARTLPICIWSIVAVAVAMFLKEFLPSRHETLPIAIAVFIATAVRYRLWRALSPDVQQGNASEKSFRRAAYVFVALLIVLGRGGYVSWSCPHGWARGFMGVGFAWSANGGPCRNTVGDLQSMHIVGEWYVWRGTKYY
jgi:hypothetical protein